MKIDGEKVGHCGAIANFKAVKRTLLLSDSLERIIIFFPLASLFVPIFFYYFDFLFTQCSCSYLKVVLLLLLLLLLLWCLNELNSAVLFVVQLAMSSIVETDPPSGHPQCHNPGCAPRMAITSIHSHDSIFTDLSSIEFNKRKTQRILSGLRVAVEMMNSDSILICSVIFDGYDKKNNLWKWYANEQKLISGKVEWRTTVARSDWHPPRRNSNSIPSVSLILILLIRKRWVGFNLECDFDSFEGQLMRLLRNVRNSSINPRVELLFANSGKPELVYRIGKWNVVLGMQSSS